MPESFRWSSYLGIGTALFLAAGAFELLIGLLAPIVGLPPTVVGLSTGTDQALYGHPTQELLQDPTVLGLRTHHTIVVGGLLAGLGILGISVAWFGLRQGQAWALPVLVLGELVMWPFWALMIFQYSSVGVPVALFGDVQPFVVVPAVLLTPAGALSWLGLRSSKGDADKTTLG